MKPVLKSHHKAGPRELRSDQSDRSQPSAQSTPDSRQWVNSVELSRVAVICSQALAAVHYWPSEKSAAAIARLTREEQIGFDYFPVYYMGKGAAESVNLAFDKIDACEARPFDLILVIGDTSGDADIGMIHQVLGPRILAAPAPVFTALGPDDGKTVLGDSACKVFATVDALAEFLLARIGDRYLEADQALARIRSLGQFLLDEHKAESKILLQAALQPTLRGHVESLDIEMTKAGARLQYIARQVQSRLNHEEAMLEHFRVKIGIELARIASNNAASTDSIKKITDSHPAGNRKLTKSKVNALRTIVLILFAASLAVTGWWTTSGASTVFAVVAVAVALSVLGALYIAINGRLVRAARFRTNDPVEKNSRLAQPLSNTTNHCMDKITPTGLADGGNPHNTDRIEPWLK